jgi:hypothetical protein
MAGYSGTPLVKKIGIKPGHRLAILNSPEGFEKELTPLPGACRTETARRWMWRSYSRPTRRRSRAA